MGGRRLVIGALVFLATAAGAEERRKRILLSNDDGITADVGAMRAGYVAVTPLRIDVNDAGARQAIEAWGLR